MSLSIFFLLEFSEIPLPVIVSKNQEAVFRCRHVRQDAFINWQVNRFPIQIYSDIVADTLLESNGTYVGVLTISATPVYNGSEVVCVATLIGSTPETTPPVTLTITGLL